MRLFLALSIMFALPSVPACSGSAAQAGLTAADSAALRQLDSSFVRTILERDWPGLAALYTDSAVLLPPNGAAVTGAIGASQWFAATGLRITAFTTSLVAMDGRGDLGAIRGTYTLSFTVPPDTQAITDSGKSVWVVRRSAGGRWRIAVDIWNTSQPLPNPAP